jgi:ABC-2 type transport system ATP-binding protein
MEDVESLCKRLIIINHGKIVYDGPTKKIRAEHLTRKRIVVVLEEKVDNLGIKNVKQLYRGAYKHAIEVDTAKYPVREVIKKILSKHKVNDITILDPPIEEIIEQIFKKEV